MVSLLIPDSHDRIAPRRGRLPVRTHAGCPDGLRWATPSLSAELRERHDDLFDAFWEHPFLAGLRDGTLERERVVHYVGQDHLYLSAFIRCYGLGMSMSPDRDWMRWFADNVTFLLEADTHPHHALCRAAGVSYAEAQRDRLAPSAQAYVDHMMESARDTLGVMLGALLPYRGPTSGPAPG